MHLPIRTANPAAQRSFDEGLAWCYAFHHDEALRCFAAAAAVDPQCAMAQWGIAYACGPHINNMAMSPELAQRAHAAAERARELATASPPLEQALIAAIGARYAWPAPDDRKQLDAAYAQAMRAVYAAHGDSPEVAVLFAEALMDLRPWDLWTADGEPQPGTDEITSVLERVLAAHPTHPQACHLYIHAVEASRTPNARSPRPNGSARWRPPPAISRTCRRTRSCASVATKRPPKPIAAASPPTARSSRAPVASASTRSTARTTTTSSPTRRCSRVATKRRSRRRARWWPSCRRTSCRRCRSSSKRSSRCRSTRWCASAAGSRSWPNPSRRRGRRARAPCATTRAASRWQPSVARPKPRPSSARSRRPSPRCRLTGCTATTPVRTVLAIGEAFLAGEIAFRGGDHERAFAELRTAVARSDALRYDEPWGWMMPPRHALGALLLEAGRAEEAAAVYREDLVQHPNNGWALHGLAECQNRLGQSAAAATTNAAFERAWATATVRIGASCFCRRG